MSTSTLESDLQVGNALANLAIARATRMEAETALVYTRQLEDVPAALIERACVRLANEPREAFGSPLPSVGDIRAMVRTLQQEDAVSHRVRMQALLPKPNDADPSTWVHCRNCQDEGWIIHQCAGGEARTCGRSSKGSFVTDATSQRTHYWGSCRRPHTFAVRCMCFDLHRVSPA